MCVSVMPLNPRTGAVSRRGDCRRATFPSARSGDPAAVERSDEQARENERRFKDANEQIRERREQLTTIDGATPYLGECEEPRGRELIRLTLEEYAAARD